MANPEHLAKLQEGVQSWNESRTGPAITPDLSEADFSGKDLFRADLRRVDLSESNLPGATLRGSNLQGVRPPASLWAAQRFTAATSGLTSPRTGKGQLPPPTGRARVYSCRKV